jgi:hypothetical protein
VNGTVPSNSYRRAALGRHKEVVMRRLLAAAALLSAASITSIAIAQNKPVKPDGREPSIVTQQITPTPPSRSSPDARELASDAEVGEARRAYRAACARHETAGFCDCVTAGVAQTLMPVEVRMAARTFAERIPAQGDAYAGATGDMTVADMTENASSAARIEHVEAHYANACARFR